jgi:predicted MPP superfamily phosphohydrolase
MLIFLSVALLIYGSMHLYALGKVWMAFPHSSALGLGLILAGIVLTFSPLLVWFLERQSWHRATVATAWVSYTWMGYLFLFLCIGLLFDLGHALATLLHFNWPLNEAMALRIVGLLALALLGYGFVEARQIQVKDVNITTPKLASGRVTIAQISDLHLGIMLGDGFLDRVIAKLRETKPDIVVATGDIIDGQGDDLEALAQHFHSYAPPLGAYAVTGNHEVYAGLENALQFLRNAGFTVLRGEAAKAGGIVLVGVDDPSAATSGQQARLDTRKALASVTRNDFIVLLKHQPVVDSDAPFDLQLSGHIHGGQIFPFVYLTRLAYGVHTGLTELADGRQLYVSRGAGTWGPPIRLFAPPEITLITISSANK